MQVGVITVDGRQVGHVSFTTDDDQDRYTPGIDTGAIRSLGGPEGAEGAPYGGGQGGHHRGGNKRGGQSPTHSDHNKEAPAPSGETSKRKPHWPGHREEQHEQKAREREPTSLSKKEDPRGLEPHIRAEARKNNVDPDTAARVAKSEGLRDFSGDHGKSHGAFQLYTGGGLGNEFQKETGLNPADPANEKATIAWAMKNVGRTGWEPYHGAKRVGIGHREGIGVSSSSVTPRPAGEAPQGLKGKDISAFIVHHTGGRGSVEGVQNTLNQRGLGVQYVMDREGNITQTGNRGASHMMTGWGKGAGLSNRNTVGMEVIARNNSDVTPAQVAAGKAFIEKNYPNTPVYGHGEVNPGHKESDEGMGIVNAVRKSRVTPTATAKPFNPDTDAL